MADKLPKTLADRALRAKQALVALATPRPRPTWLYALYGLLLAFITVLGWNNADQLGKILS